MPLLDKLREQYGVGGFAPIFPDTCYHLIHYRPAAVDIPMVSFILRSLKLKLSNRLLNVGSVRTVINYCYNNIYFLFYFILACKSLERGGV